MDWQVEFHPKVQIELSRLSRKDALQILNYFYRYSKIVNSNLILCGFVKDLNSGSLRKYKVGNYDIFFVCIDSFLQVLVIQLRI
jgi:mRNA-degrading endonuclease RelE of RelBE toxin-antitoxin system